MLYKTYVFRDGAFSHIFLTFGTNSEGKQPKEFPDTPKCQGESEQNFTHILMLDSAFILYKWLLGVIQGYMTILAIY